MIWRRHSELEGQHSFLSPSKSAWLRYDDEKIATTYKNFQAAARGTKLHEIAKQLIDEKIKLPRTQKTLDHFVNDAIGFGMNSEQVLYYSDNAFGTADAISFKNGKLRVHDLKTGVTPVSMDQLLIYAAFFCLEYGIKPSDIEVVLQIYQNDQVIFHNPQADEIVPIMDRIVTANKIIEQIKEEER